MALNSTVTLTADTWTQLTNADVTAARVFNTGANYIYIMATVGAVAPTGNGGSIVLGPGQGFAADLTLAELFPGVVGANRIYAFSGKSNPVSISHA